MVLFLFTLHHYNIIVINNVSIFSLYIAPSLKTLLNELVPVRHMWRKICIQLNIPWNKLLEFEKFEDPFTECLDYWLDGNTDVPITWGSVVAALESPDISQNLIAERLRKKWTTSEQIYEKTGGGE